MTVREIARKFIDKQCPQGVQGMSDADEKKKLIAGRLREARTTGRANPGAGGQENGHAPPHHLRDRGGESERDDARDLSRFAEVYDVDPVWLSGVGADKLDPQDERLQPAFRELKKIKPEDLDQLMRVLVLRGPTEGE